MSRPLNLASRPFRNEVLPALLFGLGVVGLLALSVQHALTLERLQPGRGTPLEQEIARLEDELGQLRSEANGLRVPDPDPKAIPRWALLKALVDRRAVRWTEMLSVFEQALPGNVRLVSLAPEVEGGSVNLELTLLARSRGDGLEVLRVLEDRPEFDQVYPLSFEPRDNGEQVRYSMLYRPPSAPASPAPGEAGAEGPREEVVAAEDDGAKAHP